MFNNPFKNPYPSESQVERIRSRYPVGARVRLVSCADSHCRIKPGDEGTVRDVDDIGTVHIDWDCGSGLGMVLSEDRIEIVNYPQDEPGGLPLASDFIWNHLLSFP